jgi:hypothetical protein
MRWFSPRIWPRPPGRRFQRRGLVDRHRFQKARIAVLRIIPGPPLGIGEPLRDGLLALGARQVPVEDMRLEQHLRPALLVESRSRRFHIHEGMKLILPTPDPRRDTRQIDIVETPRSAPEVVPGHGVFTEL